MDPIREVVSQWHTAGIALLPPRTADEIRCSLRGLVPAVSRDVLSLYQLTGGMAPGHSDKHFWSLWSLDRVVSTRIVTDKGIAFADWAIDAFLYTLRYEDPDASSVWCAEIGLVARSITELCGLYLRDPECITTVS